MNIINLNKKTYFQPYNPNITTNLSLSYCLKSGVKVVLRFELKHSAKFKNFANNCYRKAQETERLIGYNGLFYREFL